MKSFTSRFFALVVWVLILLAFYQVIQRVAVAAEETRDAVREMYQAQRQDVADAERATREARGDPPRRFR